MNVFKKRTSLAIVASTLTLAFLVGVSPRRTSADESGASQYALVVYTYKTPGVCVHCDKVRPTVQRLAREYPIEQVYRDDPDGAKRAREKRVALFPTFTLVKRSPFDGEREIERWVGSYDVERKIRAAFRNAKEKKQER